MLPASYQLPMAVALLVGGMVACFFGHRLFRLVLAFVGFLGGAVVAGSSVGGSPDATLVRTIVDSVYVGGVVLVGGLVGALLLSVAYFLGVALVGAGLGAVAAYLLLAARGEEPGIALLVLFTAIGAIASTYLERYVVIVGTAWGGAWASIVGALTLWSPGPLPAAGGRIWTITPFGPVGGGRIQMVWIVLGLIGAVVQLVRTAGHKGRVETRTRENEGQ